MRLLYQPFAIVSAIVSRLLGRKAFRAVWTKIDDKPPPKPGSGEAGMVKTVAGRALQAGVGAGVTAAVDRQFAKFFHHILGIWPQKPQKPEK